jgi:hypothetical protein
MHRTAAVHWFRVYWFRVDWRRFFRGQAWRLNDDRESFWSTADRIPLPL